MVTYLIWFGQDQLPADVAQGLPTVIRRAASPARERVEASPAPAPAPAASPARAPVQNTTQVEYSAEDGNVVLAVVGQLFQGADKNKDGRLDAEELAAKRAKR